MTKNEALSLLRVILETLGLINDEITPDRHINRESFTILGELEVPITITESVPVFVTCIDI